MRQFRRSVLFVKKKFDVFCGEYGYHNHVWQPMRDVLRGQLKIVGIRQKENSMSKKRRKNKYSDRFSLECIVGEEVISDDIFLDDHNYGHLVYLRKSAAALHQTAYEILVKDIPGRIVLLRVLIKPTNVIKYGTYSRDFIDPSGKERWIGSYALRASSIFIEKETPSRYTFINFKTKTYYYVDLTYDELIDNAKKKGYE